MRRIDRRAARPGAVLLWLVLSPPSIFGLAQEKTVTLPFTLDHNRMIVEVEFVRPDGTLRPARAWVDTGNGELVLAAPLARDLGLDLSGLKADQEQHSVETASPAPSLRLGGMPLDVEGIKTRIHPGTKVRPGVPAEANLPAAALRHHQVLLDYKALRLTVARPGSLRPRGSRIPCRVNAETGLFQITATVDGQAVQLGVDNGSAGTWVSDTLTKTWQVRHPDWPQVIGAIGSANFFGFVFEPKGVLMRLGELRIGPQRAQNVAVLGLDQRLFDWYSTKSAGPVVGFIGANVLKGFRLQIDFPNRMTYWDAGPPPESGDLDIVGLTLRPEMDGSFAIAGVAERDGKPTVEGILPGDRLVRVDALDTTNALMGVVVQALRGQPGALRTLVVERGGNRVVVEAKVMRFP